MPYNNNGSLCRNFRINHFCYSVCSCHLFFFLWMFSLNTPDVLPFLLLALAVWFILHDNRQQYTLVEEKHKTSINAIAQRFVDLDKDQKNNSTIIAQKFTDIDKKQEDVVAIITKNSMEKLSCSKTRFKRSTKMEIRALILVLL